MSDSLWPHGMQHTKLPCPSPSPWVCSNSCPLSQWCHPNHFILHCPFVLFPSIFPSIRVFFSSESALCIRWLKYWSFRFSISSVQFSSIPQLCLTLCDPRDCSTLASLSITNYQSLLKLMSIESVMPSNHLILCCPLLLLPSIFPSIRVFFSSESSGHIRWPKCWSFSFSISPSSEYSGLISF